MQPLHAVLQTLHMLNAHCWHMSKCHISTMPLCECNAARTPRMDDAARNSSAILIQTQSPATTLMLLSQGP